MIILLAAVVLQACSGKAKETKNADPASGNEVKEAEDSDAGKTTEDSDAGKAAEDSTADAAADTATQAPTPTVNPDLVLPMVTNDSGKTRIQTVSKSSTYPYNSYIITSVNGENVVVDPTAMPSTSIVDINPAAILLTHTHPDHTDSKFQLSYQCPMLIAKEGEIDTNDFHIYTIKASHSNDTIDGSNMIVVFEVDGLRIAHMGDIGQTSLTEDQLKQLGEIDIAFMQFENSYSDMSLSNGKAYTIIDQLKTKIIIPTHYSENALNAFQDKYGGYTDYENLFEITKEELPETTLNVYRILNKHIYN